MVEQKQAQKHPASRIFYLVGQSSLPSLEAEIHRQKLSCVSLEARALTQDVGSAYSVHWPLFELEPSDLKKKELFRMYSGKSGGRANRASSFQRQQWQNSSGNFWPLLLRY
jgi:hypothetical protein